MSIFYALNFVVYFFVFIFASKLRNQALLTTKHIKIMAQFKVHNLIIVDASGSMTSIYEQALAGINETLSTIREEAQKSDKIEQSVTVLSFASGGEPLQYAYRNTIAEQTSPISPNDYTLRGMTPYTTPSAHRSPTLKETKARRTRCL